MLTKARVQQMLLYDTTFQKIQNIDDTISRMLDGDFPFEAGRRALLRLRRSFEEIPKKLERANKINDVDSIKNLCAFVNLKIYQTLPVLGFILRSTNVRNPFELLHPFQHIADKLLQGKPKLLISSEWDYVPFAYPQTIEDLKGFVLIGMPASEAGNPLLSPLAAHELGHAVWKNRGLAGSVSTTLQIKCESLYESNSNKFKQVFTEYDEHDIVAKEILPESIALSVDQAAHQAEELFCDMFAFALFGASYLFAFGYIVAPGLGRATPRYPTYKTRIDALNEVAVQEGIPVPSFDDLCLAEVGRTGFPRDRFIVDMAEQSVAKIRSALWAQVDELLKSAKVQRPTGSRSVTHLAELRLGVPGCNPISLGDVSNAGWAYYREDILSTNPTDRGSAATHHLNELLLKTIEVLEFNQRTGNGSVG